MDTYISEISIGATNSHTQFGKLDLGLHTPYKPNKVPNLKKFKYDKVMGRIVQEKMRKVSGHRRQSNINPHTDLITKNVSEDPISIASAGTTFTTTTNITSRTYTARI
jgi:hypothetical protein